MAASSPFGNGDTPIAGAIFIQAAMTTASHPFMYVKTLVQVGHEPIPAKVSRTIFGNKVMRLPGFFSYASHIKKTDGWFGLYRGLSARLCHNIIGSAVNNGMLQALENYDCQSSSKGIEKTFQDEVKDFTKETCKQTVAKCASIVITHPLQVISLRVMVQYVGEETLYSGIRAGISEIYDKEGVIGFFAGMVPRIVGEVLGLWIHRVLSFIINKYLLDKEVSERKEVQVYTAGFAQYSANLLTYPFLLVSTMMAVNDVGLAAGMVPKMPKFNSWTDCFKHLRKTKSLWRGSSLFRRTVST